ncbi:MAG: WXG100 family type VII secretion target [Ruminococcus sp.]|nr:WXG100 family type VII secretion target [Ruminococcus sp.]
MGKTFTVDPQVLSDTSKKLADVSTNYRDISTQLMEKAQTMGSAWDAEDNLAFVNQITGFCDDLKNMAQKLQTASETLAMQSNNYKTHCDDNSSQVKKLAN